MAAVCSRLRRILPDKDHTYYSSKQKAFLRFEVTEGSMERKESMEHKEPGVFPTQLAVERVEEMALVVAEEVWVQVVSAEEVWAQEVSAEEAWAIAVAGRAEYHATNASNDSWNKF